MDRLRKYCEGGLSAEDERMMRDYLTEHGTDADVSECLGEIFDSIGESDEKRRISKPLPPLA